MNAGLSASADTIVTPAATTVDTVTPAAIPCTAIIGRFRIRCFKHRCICNRRYPSAEASVVVVIVIVVVIVVVISDPEKKMKAKEDLKGGNSVE